MIFRAKVILVLLGRGADTHDLLYIMEALEQLQTPKVHSVLQAGIF